MRRVMDWAVPPAALSGFANVPGYHCIVCAFGPGVSAILGPEDYPSDGVWCEA